MYQDAMEDPKIRALDLRAKHSFKDVFQAAKDAESAYLEAGRKVGLRNLGRVISAKSEAVVPYLRLIPNGFLTSILYGGLRLVFELSSL